MHTNELSKQRWPDPEDGPWIVALQVVLIAGHWEPVGLAIEPADQESPVALTSTVLRRLHLPRLLAEHAEQNRRADEALASSPNFKVVLDDGRELSPAEAANYLRSVSSAGEACRRAGRPTHWNRSRLAEVAETYRQAWQHGKPTAAVAAHFHLSPSTAGKVVHLCRLAGLLPPTTKGRAGWIEEGSR